MSSDYGSDISDGDLEAIPEIIASVTPARGRVEERGPGMTTRSSSANAMGEPLSQSKDFETPGQAVVQQCLTPQTASTTERGGNVLNMSQAVDKPKEPYTFKFGKHKGQYLSQVPAGYIGFLKKQGIKDPTLRAAVERWDSMTGEEKVRERNNDLARQAAKLRRAGTAKKGWGLPTLPTPVSNAREGTLGMLPPSSSQPTPSKQQPKRNLPWLQTPVSNATDSRSLGMLPPSSSQPTPSKQQPMRNLPWAQTPASAPRSLQLEVLLPSPSLQPTPSKQPTQIRGAPMSSPVVSFSASQPIQPQHALPQASMPASSQLAVASPRPSSQSTPMKSNSAQKLLYRFPFGIHKGKTLLDVSEDYFKVLELQGFIEHMAGLKEALALFRQGKPPIDVQLLRAAMDFSSSVNHTPPPSTALTRPDTTPHLPPMSSAPVPSSSASEMGHLPSTPQSGPNESNSSPADYRFNFGKYEGKMVSEVPEDYLQYLKEKKIGHERPDLADAIAAYDREHPPERRYKLTFGKNKGRSLFDVTPDYIDFLKDNNIPDDHPDLAAAMQYFDQIRNPPKTKKKTSKKRKSQTSSPRPKRPRRIVPYW